MKWPPIADWWSKRPLREQLMVAAVAVALPLALVDALFTAPLARRLQRETAQLETLRDAQRTRQQQRLERQAGQAAARQLQDRLQARLQAARVRQGELDRRIADAARLPEVLRTLAGTVGEVRVLSLELGAASTPAAAPTASSPGGRPLHRLPITLKVSASWTELEPLLAQIERHAEALEWSSLRLDGTRWPAIELTLVAHVLSRSPRWGDDA